MDEAKFIVGIDLGNSATSVSYFDYRQSNSEILDVSGGYGKASIPTAMQYIKENKEWIFGEYALADNGGIICTDLIERLGENKYFEIDNQEISLKTVLGKFIAEAIENIKNVNPNAEIMGIVASTEDNISEEARKELLEAFEDAGYGNILIKLAGKSECLIKKVLYEESENIENILILDFGYRKFEGKLFKIKNDYSITAESIYKIENDELSMKILEEKVFKLFKNIYKEESGKEIDEKIKEQIKEFAYIHKDLIFQRLDGSDCRLYFNFTYPPIKKNLSAEDIKKFIMPSEQKLNEIIDIIFENANVKRIDKVILCGGGFEINRFREICENIFGEGVFKAKGNKRLISDGACLLAADTLGIINGEILKINLAKTNIEEIGIITRDYSGNNFIPLIGENLKNMEKSFIIMSDNNEAEIQLYRKKESGKLIPFENIKLTDLPRRPKGGLRMSIKMEFNKENEIDTIIKDCGFGEIFPKTGYEFHYKKKWE